MKRKRLYEESYKTCLFLSRIEFYLMAGDVDDPVESALQDKIEAIIYENHLWDEKNCGFIGRRSANLGWRNAFIGIPLFFNCTFGNPIYDVPGFYDARNGNPRRVYQEYCKAFDGKLTPEEMQIIETAAIREGDDFRCYADEAWDNMKHQMSWSWRREIPYILGLVKLFNYIHGTDF